MKNIFETALICVLIIQIGAKNSSNPQNYRNITCIDSTNDFGFCKAYYFCYKLYENDKLALGCMESADLFENLAYCSISYTKTIVKCCDSYDLCNKDIVIAIETVENADTTTVTILSVFVAIGVLGSILAIFAIKKYFKKKAIKIMLESIPETFQGGERLKTRTEANEVELFNRIGNGRYGNVHRAFWRGQTVAVKIFTPEQRESWSSELKLMKTQFFHHSNILTLLFADKIMSGQGEQFWLLTEYHPYGSLYEYLQDYEISKQSMLEMALSIATGVEFMHARLVGLDGRPSIAHRDIKSKNILVKNDHTCCIGDFGLSVTSEHYDEEKERAAKKSIGTLRYMAPEMLCHDPNSYYFEALLSADIYSLGLVFWELLTRTKPSNEDSCPPHQLPYHEYNFSTNEEAVKVVCEKKIRPYLPENDLGVGPCFNNLATLVSFGQLIRLCWQDVFSARLKAITVKKNISKIHRFNKMRDTSSSNIRLG